MSEDVPVDRGDVGVPPAVGSVLVTGGAGYVGIHVLVELIDAGYTPVAIDNRHDAIKECVRNVKDVTGHTISAYTVDLLDTSAIEDIFTKHAIYCVLHLAGLKAVRASHGSPLLYYKMNVVASINLLQAMALHGVYRLLFSSSSKVYGTPCYLPLDEGHPTGNCTSPYGTTKYMVEEILRDVSQADTRWCIRVLRYFNPCGAHSSGKLGETVIGPPQNLMPRVCYAAQGRLDGMAIYGSDYETPDGTAVKDYTHVVDLARGHIAAIRSLQWQPGYRVYNMSRGVTHSILDMVKMFEQISGTKIQVELHGRKAGELGEVCSDPGRAASELGWRAERSLQTMCTYVREQACAVGPF